MVAENTGLTRADMDLLKNKKIVVVGGGTGLSVLLGGLKQYTSDLTAVVAVSDNGGGSGILRNELGILPPGDLRNCMVALAETQPIIKNLISYRFEQGMLEGQSFGNLFLAAMMGVTNNFPEAVRMMSEVLNVTGTVIPVTDTIVDIGATLKDKTELYGETTIGSYTKNYASRIKEVYLIPSDPEPLPEVIEKIREADVIVLGPGSLYTSIITNLLVKGVAEEIMKSKAKKIYICSVMTQPGETDGFSAYNHIKAIDKYGVKCDYIIVNTGHIDKEYKDRYEAEGACKVVIDAKRIEDKLNAVVVKADVVKAENMHVRHDPDKLAEVIAQIACGYYG